MDPRHSLLVEEYRRQREGLLAAFPELSEDIDTLADTLEGITDAPDVIAGFIRSALDDESMAEAIGIRMKDMGERKQRFDHRAEKRREAALAIMQALDMRKLELADFTASIRNVPPKVVIEDENKLPDSLCKMVRSPDKSAIKAALELGDVPGAIMGNGGTTISVRVR